MICKAEGSPRPWLEWRRNGRHVGDDPGQGEAVLLLRNVTSIDAGLYTCQAANVWGKEIISIKVEVRCKYGALL